MAGRSAKKTVSFEDGLSRLEALAAQMEAVELPLEDLLKRYEEGMKLASDLEKMLEEAKGRMQEINAGQGGEPKLTPTEMAEQGSLLDELKEE